MDEYFELGLNSYNVSPDGRISVQFDDSLAFEYINAQSLEQDCNSYDTEIIDNLRKHFVCLCNHFGGENFVGKKLVFNLAEPDGNIIRII